MTLPLHPRIEEELRRLGRAGVPAAEARRAVAPLAETLGVSRPGYTCVLEIIQESRPSLAPPVAGPSVLDSLVLGRFPTPRELEETLARARVHKLRRQHGLE
jgi:hypothetical protein